MNARARVRVFVPSLFVGLIGFVVTLAFRHGFESLANNYVLLADAWIHGHAWVAYTNAAVDVVPFHGRAYVVEGPAPALLLLPAVALFGTQTSQGLFSNVIGGVAAFALWRTCERAGLNRTQSIAATSFGFFGTSLFVCAAHGDVWFVAHVAGFAFTLLAIDECLGAGRGWLVAVFAMLAALSRFPLVLALPLYAVALGARNGGTARRGIRRVAEYAAALVPGFALSAWYNVARWGIVGDAGYAIWFRVMDPRAPFGYPMFSLAHARTQAQIFLFGPPVLGPGFPFVTAPAFGMSLLVTSLPFVYASAAKKSLATTLLWIAAIATAIPAFTYFDTGQLQYGMRHALDFEPFLFVLLVRALADRPARFMTLALYAFAAFGAIEGGLWMFAPFAR